MHLIQQKTQINICLIRLTNMSADQKNSLLFFLIFFLMFLIFFDDPCNDWNYEDIWIVECE